MLKLRSSPDHAAAACRIKALAVARFGAGEEAWLVTETLCREPGLPPRQTLIALIHPAARLVFRVAKPIAEVTGDDVAALGDPAANLAAEGCC